MKQLIAVLLGAVFLLPAQQPAPVRDDRIVVEVFRANFLATVTDKKGRFVTDLKQEDFEVVEKGKKQSILEFVAESNLPLRLAIVVDTSNSVRDRFKFQQEAATEFVKSVIRPGTDKAIIIGFDSTAQLAADMTDDVAKLEMAIKQMRPGGGTALYDALYFACRDKLMQDQPMYKFRRAIVLLGDGDDNASRYTRDQALEMAQKADTVLYTISTNNTRMPNDGDKILKYLSQETGGITFFPFRASDLTQSFENIANELRSQYAIVYRPEPLKLDGLYHEVEIRVKTRKDFIVRTRKGYYAPRT
jgi:Ca-activated chloride channel homolog